MADGAVALLIGSKEAGDHLSIKPLARIRAMVNVNDCYCRVCCRH